jgi:hypothetical protein
MYTIAHQWQKGLVFLKREEGLYATSLLSLGLALLIGVAVAKVGWVMGLLAGLACIGAPVLAFIALDAGWGVYLMVAISVFMNAALKLIPDLPIGLLMDFCILIMVLGVLYRCYHGNSWSKVFKTPISWVIGIWSGWHLMELANPIAASRVAWFYVARPALGYILIFFVAYGYLDTEARIRKLFFFIIACCGVSGVWGVIQFVNGYFPFEMNYIVQHQAVHLVFIQGRWRSFGPMSSPAHFGVVMAYMTVCSILMMRLAKRGGAKFLLLLSAAACLMALVYSGARSGYAVLPLSLAVMVGLSQNVKLYIACAIAGMGLAVVVAMPTDNYHIKRIQSTFKSEEDLSYNVREENRRMITPWILAHPMGGGLGSTGVWGQRFSPGTFLANFPPDSGYVRIAVEMGWIGLGLYALLWIVILWNGIIGFFKIKHPPLKLMALCILVSIVPLVVVEMAQDIVGKLPSNMLFWVFLAILMRCIDLGKNPQCL